MFPPSPLCRPLVFAVVLALVALRAGAEPQDVLAGDPFERMEPELRSALAAVDARAAGWDSEVRSDAAGAQLKRLARWLESGGQDSAALEGVLAPEFRYHPGPELVEAFQDGTLRARQPGKGARAPLAREEFLASLLRSRKGDEEVHAKFKLVRVELEPELVTETILLLSAQKGAARTQWNAWWRCRWRNQSEGPPQLVELTTLDEEEIQAPSGLFSDCSEAVLGATSAWRELLLPGLSSWRARVDTRLGVPLLGHAAGIAVGDVDGDGLEDLYLCQPGGLPNKLLVHRPDGTVVDRSAEAGVDFLDFSRAALLVDLDNDGDRDLVVTAAERLLFLANDGRARFWLAAAFEAPDTTSLAAADIDLDGDLDLYACAYASPYDHSALPVPYHDAENGKPNHLYENQGDFVFRDATVERGLDVNNTRFSFAASFEDYDLDGDPDLLVANDFGRNNLYRNDGGKFVDVAAEAGVEDISAGMGVTWGDADGDGRFDLYVSNMYSSAGNRIAFQRRFQAEASGAVRAQYQRHAHGNTLFRNRGDGGFDDVTPASPLGVAMGRWAWGGLFVDLNNDGWQDLVSPNGFLTEQKSDDL
jgi:hypothetical protein